MPPAAGSTLRDGGGDKAGDAQPSDEVEASAAPLMDHLIELRSRLIVCIAAIAIAFVFCFAVSRPLFDFLIIPFVDAVKAAQASADAASAAQAGELPPPARDPTLYFAPLEFFFTRVRLAVFAAVALAFPVVAYETYKFVAPGLYSNEKKAALPFVFAMPLLFALGASLVYFVLMPFVMRFAVGFEAEAGGGAPANFELLTRVSDYLSLITTLILAFGFAFQLPVFLTLLAHAGLVTADFLVRNRRFAVVGIFVVAAFLTPPDPFSQVILGLSILGLYEVSIISVRLATRKREAAANPEPH